jgi:hypothetical protein
MMGLRMVITSIDCDLTPATMVDIYIHLQHLRTYLVTGTATLKEGITWRIIP